MSDSLLTRTLMLKTPLMVGDDVYGVKRSVYRALDAADRGHRLATLEKKSASVKRTFGNLFVPDVNECRALMGFKKTSRVDEPFWNALVKGGWADAFAISLMNKYADEHVAQTLCFPIPMGELGKICQGLHQTAGDDSFAQNWAIDFCAAPRTTIVAVEAGVVTKLSGHDPNDDTWDSQGVFGWSVHFLTDAGYHYYLTHLGVRIVKKGMRLQMGDTIGLVGDQDFRPDHVHYGVTSPSGSADAKRRITAVSKAPRIH